MKTLMIILAVALTACGQDPKKKEAPPVCAETAMADYVVYPDGEGRKSRQVTCTYASGARCVYTTSTANPNVAFVACE